MMKHSIRILGALAAIAWTTSSLALAQPQERAKGGAAGAEARQKTEERVPEATATETPKPADSGARSTEATQREAATGKAEVAAEARAKAGEKQEAGQAQRGAAMERQTAKRDEVHARRMAQLQRLRDLAVENDRKDMIARVDGLIGRELERHSRAGRRAAAAGGEAQTQKRSSE